MENPDWLVGIRVYRILQIVYPRTVICLTKLYKKLLAILLLYLWYCKKAEGVSLAVGGSSRSQLALGRVVKVG